MALASIICCATCLSGWAALFHLTIVMPLNAMGRSRPYLLRSWLLGWALMLLLGLGIAPQAIASPICRSVEGHDICLIRIQRSAKYHWEYRAEIAINGEKRPQETYDCRHRVRFKADGTSVKFADDGAIGPLLCQLVHR